MLSLCIAAPASNQGKTILTTALLWYFRDSVRPFKVGPDFIDPQFHERVCGVPSVNLDTFIMSPEQVAWEFEHYADRDVAIIEGVMGVYDGEDRGCSTHSVSALLGVPTVLVLDGSGSYITLSAVLKGLREYRAVCTIAGVVLNKLSSASHYELIARQIRTDHPDIVVLGWIPKNLPALRDTHLGLELEDLDRIEAISREVLAHIDMEKVMELARHRLLVPKLGTPYPFPSVSPIDKKLAVVHDRNFSFLYHDNLEFLREVLDEVVLVDATADEVIPAECDALYLPGGYVETEAAYRRIADSDRFRQSLIAHATDKPVYAECAGLLYLGKWVDDKMMAGVLDIAFALEERFVRLGYYQSASGVRGHAFHYTRPDAASLAQAFDPLSKPLGQSGDPGSWQQGMVRATYLHTMFRAYPELITFITGEKT